MDAAVVHDFLGQRHPTSTLDIAGRDLRWSLTTLRENVLNIGAKVIAHGGCFVFQMADVAVAPDS